MASELFLKYQSTESVLVAFPHFLLVITSHELEKNSIKGFSADKFPIDYFGCQIPANQFNRFTTVVHLLHADWPRLLDRIFGGVWRTMKLL